MTSLVRLLSPLSLRQRFLVAPLMGLGVLAVLALVLILQSNDQNRLLRQGASEFAAYDRRSDDLADLTRQHLVLKGLLLHSVGSEADVMASRAAIDKSVLDLQESLAEDMLVDRQQSSISQAAALLTVRLQQYQSAVAALSATGSAADFQISIDTAHYALNEAFSSLLDIRRAQISAEIDAHVRDGEIATGLASGLSGLAGAVVLFTSLHLAQVLSRRLGLQVGALVQLSEQAGVSVPIGHARDLDGLSKAIAVFRQTIFSLRANEAAARSTSQRLAIALQELEAERESLESRVRQRTQALSEANATLHAEVGRRVVTERRNQIYAEIVRSTGEAVAITDRDGIIIDVNPAYEQATGRARPDALAKPLYAVDGTGDDQQRRKLWQAVRRDGRWSGEVVERRSTGESFPSWALLNAVHDQVGDTLHYVCVSRDITELKQNELQLKQLAFYDSLTHLPNRTLFHDRLDHGLAEARRYDNRMALIYVDLDRFKVVNDGFGHALGDELLRAVAIRLQAIIRDSDTVARLGGDEFVILLSSMGHVHDADVVARKVLAALEHPFEIAHRTLHVTGSVGVSVFPGDGDTAEVLLKHADAAMYRAKDIGRNTIQFYTPEMGVEATDRMELVEAMHRALQREEFELHYQPQASLKTGAIVGLEALIRWHHPERGLVPPDRFIPVAEDHGLIGQIGAWVLRTACMQMKQWHDAGHTKLSIGVNLSARQFQHENMPLAVQKILAETGLPAAALDLELTESLLMQDRDGIGLALASLKEIGVQLSLDDFGTGYSSLSYLKRFPIDVVKIDRSFVADITAGSNGTSLTRAIIAMAQSLGMRTIAEGVETRAQLDALTADGCDSIQGYFLSRPLTAEAATQLLSAGTRLVTAGADALSV